MTRRSSSPRGPFPAGKIFLGVIHLPPLPGSPRWSGDLTRLRRRVLEDAETLARGGADGILVENLGDVPYAPGRVAAETVASMAALVEAVTERVGRARRGRLTGLVAGERTRRTKARARRDRAVAIGVNVLRSDGPSAMAIAASTGARFIRVNVHAGAAWCDQGLVQGRAYETARLRAALQAEVWILADVWVKHAAPAAPSRPLAEEARETVERGLADGLIVTGSRTGAPADEGHLAAVREAVPRALLLAGSGVTAASASRTLRHADGAIVGTALHRGGRLDAPLDGARVRAVAQAIHAAG